MPGWQWLEVDEFWLLWRSVPEGDAGHLVQEGPVLEFLQPVFFCSRFAVGVVSGIRLGDVHASLGIGRDAVQQGAQGVDSLDQLVCSGVEDVEVAVWNPGMLDDVQDMAKRQHVVDTDRVLVGIKGLELAIEWLGTTGELRLVVGFEGDDVQPVPLDGDGPWVLGSDGQSPGDPAVTDVDHGNGVFRRQGHVGLLVVGECDANRFVKAGGPGGGIEILDRRDDLEIGRAVKVGVDHADRIGHVIGDPEFFAVGSHGQTHRVDSDGDAGMDLASGCIDDIDRVGRRVRDEDPPTAEGDRGRMRTHERRVPDQGLCPGIGHSGTSCRGLAGSWFCLGTILGKEDARANYGRESQRNSGSCHC